MLNKFRTYYSSYGKYIMYSNKEYLDQTIAQFPGPQNYLRRLCEEEKQKTKIEIENMVERFEAEQEGLVKRAAKLFECDTSAFKQNLAKDSKHELQLMENDDPDYELLKGSLGLSAETNRLKKYSNKNVALRIYRVKSNVESCNCPSLLLLHGTKGSNIEGILREGLRPSSSGRLGPGIYLTNSFEIAHRYGNCYAKDEGSAKDLTCLFVGKVKETLASSIGPCGVCKDDKSVKTRVSLSGDETTSIVFVESRFQCLDSSFSYEPVLKVFDGNYFSDKRVEFKDPPSRKFDGDGNKVLSGTFQAGDEEKRIFVAHHDLVSLAYLIEVEITQTASELAQHILYGKLYQTKFSKDPPKVSEARKGASTKNFPAGSKDCSMDAFVAEVRKEISANQRAEVEVVKEQFERKVNSFMRQLLFETSSISETNSGRAKYKAELLQTSHPDHQFVLGSMTNSNPAILHIFRIDPVDGSERTRGGSLYLRGVSCHEVPNVLARGHPESSEDFLEECECGVGHCSCNASNRLDWELELGLSHCQVANGKVEKLSFVFVASDGESAGTFLKCDTRGCCFKTGMSTTRHLIGLIPVYLVVFNLNK